MYRKLIYILQLLLPKKVILLLKKLKRLIISTKVRIEYSFRFRRYNKILTRIRTKEVINVSFFVIEPATWKVDYLYKYLLLDPAFNPSILICPIVNYGKENMINKMDFCYEFYRSLGYDAIKAYDKESNTYISVKDTLSPDVIIYLNPYKELLHPNYHINNFNDCLTCYVPYFYSNNKGGMFYNLAFHNNLWRFFVESDIQKENYIHQMYNRGVNVHVTGYPGVDKFLDKSYTPKDIWKNETRNKKRIIWAPHHTINTNPTINYSCFLRYCDFMLELATKYEEDIQIAFKPHTVLRNKLNILWGVDKTNVYFKKWDSLSNTFLVQGDYVDLFLTSDAMIHDSGSFLIEYLYVDKPVMRTVNNSDFVNELNDFAKKAVENYYLAYSEKDIEEFILNVINNVDSLKTNRQRFKENYLTPVDNQIASKNIYDFLRSSFNKN